MQFGKAREKVSLIPFQRSDIVVRFNQFLGLYCIDYILVRNQLPEQNYHLPGTIRYHGNDIVENSQSHTIPEK